MTGWAEPQTLAAYVAVCAMCGAEVGALEWNGNGTSVIRPCGHPANVKLKRNERLRPRPSL